MHPVRLWAGLKRWAIPEPRMLAESPQKCFSVGWVYREWEWARKVRFTHRNVSLQLSRAREPELISSSAAAQSYSEMTSVQTCGLLSLEAGDA